MLKIRTIKTASKNIAVQIVWRKNHKTKIVKHIGTAKNKEELETLIELAEQYINTKTETISLFPETKNYHLVAVENLKFVHAYHNFAYEFLSYFYELNGFNKIKNDLLKNLSIIRIIEPASKLRSIELMEKHFGKKYTKNMIYKNLPKIKPLNQDIENIAVNYARNHLSFDFSLVFYDVTTLYFESFNNDEFKKCGFSKDNKSNQPQVLIGLVVNKDGYPIAVNIFEGNKFEGHTIIPVILNLKKRYKIKNLTVVADAAMLSFKNIDELKNNGLNYIVGARLANLSDKLLKEISESLNQKEKYYYKIKNQNGYLICDYSKKRAAKDKIDRKKQLLRAQLQIKNPSKSIKKSRFVKEITKSEFTLNQELIAKDELSDGIKGYYTNLIDVSDNLIVSRYKDLWHVEKSFRIAKSDLMARPIFHYKKESIETHILMVFVSLCVSKSIELLTGLSIKKVKDMIWDILDIEFIDSLTNEKFTKRMDTVSNKMVEILNSIKVKFPPAH